VERNELLQKITTFPLVSAGLARDILAGNFRSVFKGQGIEFDEVRRYEDGDDIHSIDWNVSARFGTPFVKLYREERELSSVIALDCSASMLSEGGLGKAKGEKALSPYDQAVLAAALIAFSAEKAGQRVSGIFFDRGIVRVFPARKGRSHILAMISGAMNLAGAPERAGKKGALTSNLGLALTGVKRLLKRRSMAVIISDFLCINWERELEELARRHDVIAVRITSPRDREIPGKGLLSLRDRETGLAMRVPGASPAFRAAWAGWHEERATLWEAICGRCGAACFTLSTGEDAALALKRFFSGRKGQGGR
jgi:uncharacterized protein (DUF58 family)